MKKNIDIPKTIKIAVLYGGKSKERPGSLISGEAVYKSLKNQGYKNTYLVDPIKKNFIDEVNKADIVFLILHGRYGEDGKIQGYLETIGKRYTGSGVLASALGMDKYYFKTLLNSASIQTPPFEVIIDQLDSYIADKIIKRLGLPLFLKPISEGGSLGSNVIHSKQQFLKDFIFFKKKNFDKFIAEEYIDGRSLTVGTIQKKNSVVVLPILETISKKEFYDYEAKHDPKLHTYKCPAHLDYKIVGKIKNIAKKVYKLIGCYGFCRVDFVLANKTNIPYVLEINTLPGMSLHSNMATSAQAAGVDYDSLVIKMLETAFNRPGYLP